MAGISSSRADRLIGRLPRPALLPSIEMLLLALVAVQGARLAWTLIAPLGPVGAWQAAGMVAQPPSAAAAAGAFDPFFRLSGPAGPVTVTALDLTLFGIREDKATGRGSAIIRLPDGLQGSFAVGEEILPGVVLTAVEFDSVTISRNGAREQIFLDQSPPAPAVGGEGAAAVSGLPQVAAPPSAPGQPIQFQPRMNEGQVTGFIVQPGGNGEAFRAAGFAPGDVIVSIDNQRITSADQARLLAGRSGGELSIVVERGGRAIPLRVRLNP